MIAIVFKGTPHALMIYYSQIFKKLHKFNSNLVSFNSLPSKFILGWIETEHLHIEINLYKKIKAWEGRQSIYILVGEWCLNILVVINSTFDYVTGCHGNG